MRSLDQEQPLAGEENKIWSSILEQVQKTDTKKLPSNKSLLVLGNNDTGKTTLVAKMAGLDAPKKGSGLEYYFMEIRDEYRDDATKLGVWILDGDQRNTKLLNFALTEANFENSCCLLVASMSKPWNIMQSLKVWADILESHIESLEIKASKMKQYRQRLALNFLNYVATTDEIDGKLIAGTIANEETKKRESDQEDLDAEFSDAMSSANNLGRDSLSKNLGLNIIVAITKTDQISTLERDYDYTEETFDFIQQAIRKFCLRYGAALFYVSAKVNKNCDLLHKYLAHKIYDLPFKTSASVVDKDAIFVPSGWDNEKKISILYDNIRSVDPDDEYEEFITERSNPVAAQRDAEVTVESDQDFLLRIQSELNKQTIQPTPSAPSPVQARQNLANPIDAQPSGEGVLSNFFNSLLSKGRAMPHQEQ